MSLDPNVRRIAIVGTGVIGASWAAEFLANGFEVVPPTRRRTPRPTCAIMSTPPGPRSPH